MRIAIEWIKSNLVSVISIAVVILSLTFLIVFPQLKGKGALRRELIERSRKLDTLGGLINARVELPPAQPDAPPQTVSSVTVNADVVTKLQTLYDGLERQYNGVFESAVRFNQMGHAPMLDGVFPQWSAQNPNIPFDAASAYLDAFDDMFLAHDAEYPDRARLDARMPPSAEQLQQVMEQVHRDFVFADSSSGNALTEAEQRDLDKELRDKLVDMLRQRAEQIHLYAQTEMPIQPGGAMPGRAAGGGLSGGGIGGLLSSESYPFQIGAFAFAGESPQAAQLWEGQLELWIQQDIARAIGRVNRVEDPTTNVLTAAVKRLISIEVVPGYVGLHTAGAGRDGEYLAVAQRADGAYPNPVNGQRTTNPDEKVSDNFYVGPTGRVSNALYDVRHAVVNAVVDYSQLPQLINAFSDVNFMTVLNVQVEDVDEYAALRSGYLYGSADAVLARITIETIWLRQWTEPLMPEVVKSYVGIGEPLPDAVPGMTPGLMPGMMPGMRPGSYEWQ